MSAAPAPCGGGFDYQGPEAWRQPIVQALERVVDPELAMNIVDVGLVCGVVVGDDGWSVRLTMTSAACPVTELILEEVEDALDRIAPQRLPIDVSLQWEPPWTPERMSARARRFLDG